MPGKYEGRVSGRRRRRLVFSGLVLGVAAATIVAAPASMALQPGAAPASSTNPTPLVQPGVEDGTNGSTISTQALPGDGPAADRLNITEAAPIVPVSATSHSAVLRNDSAAPQKKTVTCNIGGAKFDLVAAVPAPTFDALSASANQLAANGLPTRPSDPNSLKAWTKYVTHPITHVMDCGALQAVPTKRNANFGGKMAASTTGSKSYNWAGNVANGAVYTDAEANWTVPATSGPSNSDESTWVGVGLGNSTTYPLVQAGTEDPHNNAPNPTAWFETYPQVSMIQLGSYRLFQGDTVGVHVSTTTSTQSFHIVDESQGWQLDPIEHTTIKLDGHAEFIYERYEINDVLTPYGKFQAFDNASTTMHTAEVAAAGHFTPIGKAPHYYTLMWSCDYAEQLAYPGSISSDGTSFSLLYNNGIGIQNC